MLEPSLPVHRPMETTCCIVGGGPAGLMLGLMLARAGVDVTVLEKHADFLRDFRGDTIHPSTLDLVEELGFIDELERIPHDVVRRLRADVNGRWLTVANLEGLPTRHPFIYMMPQWDFLELLARKAADCPSFRLVRSAEVVDLLRDGERVTGVVYRSGGVTHELLADLTVACDGRGSIVRQRRGVHPVELGAPMDVLWFRIPRRPGDGEESYGVIRKGRMLVLVHRGEYWQCGYLIPKGEDARVRSEGFDRFRARLAAMVPALGDGRLEELPGWEQVFTLRVQVNHLVRWFYPGLLFLGDAAHAMSPIGGVGINLALQDAVAAANILAKPLRERRVRLRHLARGQACRSYPALVTQAIQLAAQRRIIRRVLRGKITAPPTLLPRVLTPRVQSWLARAVGLGIRPEHASPSLRRPSASSEQASLPH